MSLSEEIKFERATMSPVLPIDPSPPVESDAARLDALARTGLLDSPPEPRFDRLTALVREMTGTPVALISLVDDRRQFFKSCLGLAEPWAAQRETPLSHSFCQYVVREASPLVIEDARAHPVLRENGAVREMGVVAYAGMPITDADGALLGSLCAIDTKPRVWTERDRNVLEALAAAVSSEIGLRRHTSEVLERADASYREVVDALGEVVFRTDAEGRWTWLTPAWKRLTGYEVEESLGTPIAEMLQTEDRAIYADQIQAFLNGARTSIRQPIRFQRANGTVGWVGLRARATRDQTGVVTGMLGTLNDVSDRMEEQRILQETRDQLAAAQRLEALGRMAGAIAHDFNNVLAGAGGYADLLRASPSLDDESRRDVDEILSVVHQGQRLVRQLLQFGGHAPAEVEPLRIDEVAGDVVRMLRHTMGDAISVETQFASELPPVPGDRSQLEQVISNLVVNARDAMPEGGRLTVTTSLETSPDARSTLCLVVGDTGIGMDHATRSRIFEPFFTTKAVTGGSGLGLATVHGIITRMGGRLDVESVAGTGTTMRVMLPIGS